MRSGYNAYVMTQGPIIFADDDQELLGEKATSDGMKYFKLQSTTLSGPYSQNSYTCINGYPMLILCTLAHISAAFATLLANGFFRCFPAFVLLLGRSVV